MAGLGWVKIRHLYFTDGLPCLIIANRRYDKLIPRTR